ncbi:MAG: LysM peptidoglycan-binding domain-containing protein [Candidatus Dadabacteria bacterium]|nr:LysM peptidoglycan-binding domain-containing protein [Candidatus Dadabacteria bacterium]NIT13162.1 LysM peptidoglycan-binding domain-containing protein [Candidatus Dadabacteria bacterium]
MKLKFILPFLLLFTALSFAADKEPDKDMKAKSTEPEIKGDVSIYVVRPGDSLWKISKNFYNTPVLWPRLWKLNPAIDKPHRIYPGEVISLKRQVPRLPVVEFDPEQREFVVGDIDPPPPVYYYSKAHKVGFISPDEWEHMGTIINSEPPRLMIAEENTLVYINLGTEDNVAVGDIFTVFKTSKPVLHPVSKRRIGYKVAILGEVEIKEVLGEKLSSAYVTASNREIHRGARVRPKEEFVKEVIIRKGEVELDGVIVENRNNLIYAAQNDVVYIDAGSKDNVLPGHTFTIYQHPRNVIDLETGKNLTVPKFPIGKLVVINVKKNVSTGVIIESDRQVGKGDIVSLDM